MILAAGANLQSGKYVIQAVLHRTDLGITYQAYHVYLDQAVVLQTLNPAAHRSNFDQVRHQFVEGARHLAKYPSNHRLRAIDLFEEAVEEQSLPFVVLSLFPGQPPQKLGEWFALIPEPHQAIPQTPQIPELAAVSGSLSPLNSEQTEASLQAANPAIPAVTTAATHGSQPVAGAAPSVLPASPIAEPVAQSATVAQQPIQVQSGRSPQKASVYKESTSKENPYKESSHSVRVLVQPRRRSPNAFILTALIAGAAGAGMGLALRVQPAPQGKTPFNLGTSLFTREQSFPPEGNWPIYEPPAPLMPEPSDSQPTYSAEPALQYTPPIQGSSPYGAIEPFPSDSYTPPVAPAQPETTAPENAIRSNSAGTAPEPLRPNSLPPAFNPDSPVSSEAPLSPKPAPAAPAPAAIDPPAVAPPASVAPPPVVESAPAAPPPAPLPARPARPKVIDQ